jgi:hypothetical protein
MNDELLSNTLLIGSSIRNGPLGIVPKLTIHKNYKKSIIPVAEKLVQEGFMVHAEPTAVYDMDFNPDLNITTLQMPWNITPKGEYALGKFYKNSQEVAEARSFLNFIINIGTGAVDLRDNSKRTTTSVFNIITFEQNMLKQIDDSHGTDEEKSEAKSRLQKFLEHPLLSSAIGAVLGAVL